MKRIIMLSLRLVTNSLRNLAAQLAPVTNVRPPIQMNQQFNNAKLISSSNVLLASVPKPEKIRTALMDAEINLPPKPKKPITPWLAFVKDRKDQVLREHGKLSAVELTKILSKEWKYMDRTDYEKDFEIKQEEYHRQREDYKNSLTDAQREYLNMRKNYIREDKAYMTIRKSKPPKLPRNTPNMYIYDRCQEPMIKNQLKDRKASDVFSELFEEYRKLSEEEKQKYIELQENDKRRFQKEFNSWYDSIKCDKSLNKAVIEQANIMYARYKALNYV